MKNPDAQVRTTNFWKGALSNLCMSSFRRWIGSYHTCFVSNDFETMPESMKPDRHVDLLGVVPSIIPGVKPE